MVVLTTTPEAKEGDMRRVSWSDAMTALLLVRLGQELGTDSPAAKVVATAVEYALKYAGIFWA